jgi:L-aspartate oxidase
MQSVDVDVLVVGAGLAGLAVALSVTGRRVTLLSAWMPPGGSASAMAQGGIAAAVGAGDSPARHLADTLQAGAGACDETAARLLCEEGPAAIEWLERQGVVFDRLGADRALHLEAAHSAARVLHVDHDRTGFALSRALTRAVRARGDITLIAGHQAVALLPGPRGIGGLLALDRHSAPVCIRAADTVLATGGLGQLYARTTNPRSACGDGLGMALAAGVRCASLEYVQFHPTALDVPSDPMPLITEALRGAGAALVDERGDEFMVNVHPKAALAPRDVVAREVWRRTAAGHRVFLDARALLSRQPQSFPSVRGICASHHVDPVNQRIPVAPAAHYHMGGVAVDLHGRSSVEHLWACGEVACTGVHGANRLASNSLLEAVVFGRRTGQALSASAMPAAAAPADSGVLPGELTATVDAALWKRLRALMWEHAGIVRSEAGLDAAVEGIAQLGEEVPAGQILLSHRLRLAAALVTAARRNRTSRGAHYRSDAAVV